jgi:hypothetical protein
MIPKYLTDRLTGYIAEETQPTDTDLRTMLLYLIRGHYHNHGTTSILL